MPGLQDQRAAIGAAVEDHRPRAPTVRSDAEARAKRPLRPRVHSQRGPQKEPHRPLPTPKASWPYHRDPAHAVVHGLKVYPPGPLGRLSPQPLRPFDRANAVAVKVFFQTEPLNFPLIAQTIEVDVVE